MSHVATVDLEVKDLTCLALAAQRLGLEFRPGQTTYKWWGHHVGDYPVPEGFQVSDLGQCEHAIGWPEGTPGLGDQYACFEIGLCRRRDGRPGYVLLWDFMDQTLVNKVGKEAELLKQAYAQEVVLKQARMQGFAMQSVQQRADGSLRMVLGK